MLKGFTHARLACGCRLAFREGVEGSPVAVVVDEKGQAFIGGSPLGNPFPVLELDLEQFEGKP